MNTKIHTKVAVIGSGPGGYSAAFRCADLGMESIIIERYSDIGGVCLNVGCIPSKTLLHIVKIIKESRYFNRNGIILDDIRINIDRIRMWKDQVIKQLHNGLNHMARARKVKIINGHAKFIDANTLQVVDAQRLINISFDYVIIASGSCNIDLPFIPYNDSRIWSSTDALELKIIPKKLLIIGGGVIGLEMATIYHALGSIVDIVEVSDQLLPNIDIDMMKIFMNCVSSQFNVFLNTKVVMVKPQIDGIYVTMENKLSLHDIKCYDIILVAVGRIPNSRCLGIDCLDICMNNEGFIFVDRQMRTNLPNVFAIGDVVGKPMLAHKAIHEAHIAAEVIAGKQSYFEPKAIPCVIYTDPEISWVGLTAQEACKNNISYECATFPWFASGRAITSHYQQGMTRLIFNKNTNKIIGGIVIGVHSSELLGEIGLAIEMGCDAADISKTVHAHPTLYESIGLAASVYEGSITDLPNIKANKLGL